MRPGLFTVLLLALSLAACAGRPVRDLSRRAGSIEIAAAAAEEVAPTGNAPGQTGYVAAAGGLGAAAGLTCGPMAIVCSPVFGLATATAAAADIAIMNLLDKTAATRTRAFAERMLGTNAAASFVADIASRLQKEEGKAARASGPALRLDLAVSRLELQPRFPADAQLLVWIEARLHCAESPCGATEVRQRYVHVGDVIELRDIESNPDLFARYIALSQEQLALEIGRDLRR